MTDSALPIPATPELDRLVMGYRRFRDTGWTPKLERWRQLRESQSPEIMVIACSDSRVDPAQIFDTDPGEMFVVRNVAAMVPPFETAPGHHGVSAALEFAVQVLGVKEVVVMGHGMCGGCRAALTDEMRGAERGEGGFIADWIAMLD
ncbi:MAG: carbonic anhydrase, partial [Novosphingobium sp.]|nr:carbonic anhydrase [Novosphingobium sp.]